MHNNLFSFVLSYLFNENTNHILDSRKTLGVKTLVREFFNFQSRVCPCGKSNSRRVKLVLNFSVENKAPGRSQLSKFDTGALGPNDPTRPERTPSHGTPTRTDAIVPHDQTTRPTRTPSPGTTERPDPNGRTREQTANGPPGRAQGTRAVTT